MDERFKSGWEKAYHAALVEVDPHKLQLKIKEAETLIFTRLSEGLDSEELQALEDALNGLKMLKREAKLKSDTN